MPKAPKPNKKSSKQPPDPSADEEDLGPLEDISPQIALQKWSSDVVNRLGVSSTSLFHPDASGDFDVQLEKLIAKNRENNNNNNNNNNDALKRSKSNTSSSQSKSPGLSSGDPIKSGDLAHLGFPFDGQIGKDELKESLREAFREMSDVKVKPMNDDNAKKKMTKSKMTSSAISARKSGGDVASLDDAWAKINSGKKRGNDNDANGRGKDETTLEDVMMDVVMANNAKKIGNGNIKRTATASLIMAQKSLFSAGAQDLANTLGVAHTQNASSMEQMVNEANLTSYDTEMARMLSTFGSGSGSGGTNNAFDQHAKRTSYNQALEKEMDKKKENKKPLPTPSKRKQKDDGDDDAAKKQKRNKDAEEANMKKRKVSKTNVPRLEIDNTQIVELTKENKNLIVTPGGIKDALPPRKKGRRPNNPTVVETEEETKLRAEERVYKNRQSAARSRARKLKTIAELQEEISRLTCENDAMRDLCKDSGVTEATITTQLKESEATRQKEKKEQEELGANVKK